MTRIGDYQSQPFQEDQNIGPQHPKSERLKKTHFQATKSHHDQPIDIPTALQAISDKVYQILRSLRENPPRPPTAKNLEEFWSSSYDIVDTFRKDLKPLAQTLVDHGLAALEAAVSDLKDPVFDLQQLERRIIFALSNINAARQSVITPTMSDAKLHLTLAYEFSIHFFNSTIKHSRYDEDFLLGGLIQSLKNAQGAISDKSLHEDIDTTINKLEKYLKETERDKIRPFLADIIAELERFLKNCP